MRISLLIFITFLFFAPHAFAAVSYTVSPLVIDTEAEARDIFDYELTLTNTGTQQVTIYPSVNNISVDAGGTIEAFLPPSASDRTRSLASWIEISRSGIGLKPGESKTVTMTLRVNPFPVPGEYHAYLGFGYGSNQGQAHNRVREGRAPGTVVTVTIIDRKNELLRLSRFLIDRFITSAENQSAKYIITNPGETPLVPTGEIIFYNKLGAEVASLPVNPDNETVLPDSEKEFTVVVPTEGLFGRYKAFLNVEYGSAFVASVQDTQFFYVFPMQTLLIILGALSISVVIISYLFHRKYLGEETAGDDSETLGIRVKREVSESKGHDINLKGS